MYYDKFSKFYDLFSPKSYYHKARFEAVKQLQLKQEQVVLNVPVGTGQNFEYFQQYLHNTGNIIGVDNSAGMLKKAQQKIELNNWNNIQLINQDATELHISTLKPILDRNGRVGIDAILCDLGLSGFPRWKEVIDNLINILGSTGKLVVMDWYIEKPSLRGELVKWIGKGKVDRKIWQYMEIKLANFQLNTSFNRGGVFVASGTVRGKNFQ